MAYYVLHIEHYTLAPRRLIVFNVFTLPIFLNSYITNLQDTVECNTCLSASSSEGAAACGNKYNIENSTGSASDADPLIISEDLSPWHTADDPILLRKALYSLRYSCNFCSLLFVSAWGREDIHLYMKPFQIGDNGVNHP